MQRSENERSPEMFYLNMSDSICSVDAKVCAYFVVQKHASLTEREWICVCSETSIILNDKGGKVKMRN